MSMEYDPANRRAQPNDGANEGTAAPPGRAKTTGNLSFGIVAIVAFVIFVVLYRLLLSRF